MYSISSLKNRRLGGYFMNSRRIVSFLVAVVFLLSFTGMLQAGDRAIEKIAFKKVDAQNESVSFYLNGPWIPKVFVLKGENPRVVFDFMETGLADSVPASLKTKGNMINKIRMGRYSNKTRVVLDLNAGNESNFDQNYDETSNVLTISIFSTDFPAKQKVEVSNEAETVVETVAAVSTVDKSESKSEEVVIKPETQIPVESVPAVTEAAVVTKKAPVADPLILEVSFEDTSDKGEMVLFKLNGFYPPTVKGEEEGTPFVICDFAGTRIAEEVVAEQIVKGKYIEKISVQKLDDLDVVRVRIELIPHNNYDLQQVFFKEDNLFVIIVNSYDALNKQKK